MTLNPRIVAEIECRVAAENTSYIQVVEAALWFVVFPNEPNPKRQYVAKKEAFRQVRNIGMRLKESKVNFGKFWCNKKLQQSFKFQIHTVI